MTELLQHPMDQKTIHVSKEMTSFSPLHIPDAALEPWLRQFRHAILVRKPLHSLASLKRVGTQGTHATYFDPVTEAGFREAFWLRARLHRACGSDSVPVIDADDDLMAHPEQTLALLCRMVGVSFDPCMLS